MAIPEMNFKNISAGIMNIPSANEACAMDEFMQWIDAKGMDRAVVEIKQNEQGTTYETHFDPKTIAIALGRTAATAFILPVIATIGAAYNLGVGLTKIGLGVVTHMKIDPQAQKAAREEMRETARTAVRDGIQHILTAVYDFAIGILSTLIALVYGAAPQAVTKGHDVMYRGVNEAPVAHKKDDDAVVDLNNGVPVLTQVAEKLTDGMFPQAHHGDLAWYQRMNPWHKA